MQAAGEDTLDGIQAGEDVVGEAVLAQRFAQVSGWVQLGAVRRQEQQPHVVRHHQLAGQVPARLIDDHEHELRGMALRDLGRCQPAQDQP